MNATAAPNLKPLPAPESASDRPRVAHGVLSLDVGGLERMVLDMIRGGDRASILCVERPGRLAGEAEALGASVDCLNKPPGRSAEAVRRSAVILERLAPDIVHTHQIGALWHIGQAAKSLGIPVIHTEHGNQLARATGWFGRWKAWMVIRRAARWADRFCCVSEEIADTLARRRVVPRRKLDVVANGIRTEFAGDPAGRADVRRRLDLAPNAPLIGTVGRLSEVKRQDLLLRAVHRLPEAFADVHVLFVGDGPERSALQQLAETLGIARRVRFAGYEPHPERMLNAMDVFALTSRSEGLPLSLLEAWAAGMPVVASAVGGIPQVVDHGVNGLLFPFGDIDALTNRLETILAEPPLAAALGSAGRRTVRARFSLETMLNDYALRYHMLAAPASRSR